MEASCAFPKVSRPGRTGAAGPHAERRGREGRYKKFRIILALSTFPCCCGGHRERNLDRKSEAATVATPEVCTVHITSLGHRVPTCKSSDFFPFLLSSVNSMNCLLWFEKLPDPSQCPAGLAGLVFGALPDLDSCQTKRQTIICVSKQSHLSSVNKSPLKLRRHVITAVVESRSGKRGICETGGRHLSPQQQGRRLFTKVSLLAVETPLRRLSRVTSME